MKRFMKDLGITFIYSVCVTTASIVGLGISGILWSKKVEPWIHNKLGI